MDFLTYFLISLALTVVSYLIAPKPSAPKPSIEDFKSPTAEAGRPIPVPFGTIEVQSPNYLWYGAKQVLQRKAKNPPAGYVGSVGQGVIEDPRYEQQL